MFITSKIKAKDIRVNDILLARNVNKKNDGFRPVLNTMTPYVIDQVELVTSLGYSVCTSSTHPIAVLKDDKEEYIPTKDVKIGDILITSDGYQPVTDIKSGTYSPNFVDFTIDEFNNYYAGNESDKLILAHNSATAYFPWWHFEFKDLVVLKNNKGVEETRARHLDYGVQFNKLAYERLLEGRDVTLFSPNDVPGLYDAFFSDQDKFKKIYEEAEKNPNIRKETVKAIDLFTSFMTERKDTSRMYLMNADHMNTHSPFDESVAPIRQSNLCLTGDTIIQIKLLDDSIISSRLDDFVQGYKNGVLDQAKVLSYNTDNEQFSWEQVSAADLTANVDLLTQFVDSHNNVIRCTPDHQIFTMNRGWVPAGEITTDDTVVNNNQNIVVESKVTFIASINVNQEEVYDITVPSTSTFVANNIVVHNCAEIGLPTEPLENISGYNVKYNQDNQVVIEEDPGLIALCTLSAINWGKIKEPKDFEKYCTLAVRGLDNLLDYQTYPVLAAERHTKLYRPLGIGITNLAYFLAKNNVKYSDDSALNLVDEYAEAWSYYMIKASVELAKEKGAISGLANTKYAKGILPIDTQKPEVNEIVPLIERMPWTKLREDLKIYGIRNATLLAVMPGESSSQLLNATNGIEPPRSLVSIKQSKHGILKQVVPEYRRLKNKYDLLWDQKSPEGYLKIAAILQRYIDQSISTNVSYNPDHYPEQKLPMSEMLKHMLLGYKWGLKTFYYMNTNDGAGEVDVDKMITDSEEHQEYNKNIDDDNCESCSI